MERKYYWLYFEELGEIGIPMEEAENGLTIHAPELQGYTDKQLKKFANNCGDGYFNDTPYTRENGLEFLAWYINGDIADGSARVSTIAF